MRSWDCDELWAPCPQAWAGREPASGHRSWAQVSWPGQACWCLRARVLVSCFPGYRPGSTPHLVAAPVFHVKRTIIWFTHGSALWGLRGGGGRPPRPRSALWGLCGGGGRPPRPRSALWGLRGDGGRPPRPRLCSDPLSPTPAALAGTHADVDSVPGLSATHLQPWPGHTLMLTQSPTSRPPTCSPGRDTR